MPRTFGLPDKSCQKQGNPQVCASAGTLITKFDVAGGCWWRCAGRAGRGDFVPLLVGTPGVGPGPPVTGLAPRVFKPRATAMSAAQEQFSNCRISHVSGTARPRMAD